MEDHLHNDICMVTGKPGVANLKFCGGNSKNRQGVTFMAKAKIAHEGLVLGIFLVW